MLICNFCGAWVGYMIFRGLTDSSTFSCDVFCSRKDKAGSIVHQNVHTTATLAFHQLSECHYFTLLADVYLQ